MLKSNIMVVSWNYPPPLQVIAATLRVSEVDLSTILPDASAATQTAIFKIAFRTPDTTTTA
jgi:hypothetical protein